MSLVQVISSVGSKFGGPAVGSVALNRALNELGVATVLLSAAYDEPGATRRAEVSDLGLPGDLSGARLKIFSPSRPYGAENSWPLLWSIFWEVRKSDGVHVHGLYRLPATWAVLSAMFWKKPFGVQPHGNLEPYQRLSSSRKKAIFDKFLTAKFVAKARYVQFASQSEADRASAVVPIDKWMIKSLGASLDVSVRPINLEALTVEVRDRHKVFLFLGRLAKKKRPDLLLEAWALVPEELREDALLVIAGPDSDWTAVTLRELAEDLGVGDSVVLWGNVSGGEKTWLYEQSGAFVLPSENENFGITVVEAMLAGCHVIASSEVASTHHLISAESGVVLWGPDAGRLSACIESALRNPDGVTSSGRRAKEYAKAELSWKGLARGVADQFGFKSS